jgi:glycosyltransferase involved in cell wall biosynthesis
MTYREFSIALIVPCFNEALTIAQVINTFRSALPAIEVYVFDNNSTDQTAAVARQHQAEVIRVTTPGKGNVVRRMFSDIDCDIYVMVDGDATYCADSVVGMINKLIDERLDMVVGCRQTTHETAHRAYRLGHEFGNKLLTRSVTQIFGGTFTDMLSGYRIFSRRYVKSFPALSKGFEIETELTVHALELRMPYGEVMTPYGARPPGSHSKLSTYSDGWRILKTIGRLFIAERPLAFFGLLALTLFLLSVALALPIITEFMHTGLVPRFPTAILSASLVICGLLSATCGLILANVTRGRQEIKRLAYLAVPGLKPTKHTNARATSDFN